jgi:hypothetical protein
VGVTNQSAEFATVPSFEAALGQAQRRPWSWLDHRYDEMIKAQELRRMLRGSTFADFQVVSVLGTGCNGQVFRCVRTFTPVAVAVAGIGPTVAVNSAAAGAAVDDERRGPQHGSHQTTPLHVAVKVLYNYGARTTLVGDLQVCLAFERKPLPKLAACIATAVPHLSLGGPT